MDGLLGVAGMMTLLVMKWIIPENSLRLAPVRINEGGTSPIVIIWFDIHEGFV